MNWFKAGKLRALLLGAIPCILLYLFAHYRFARGIGVGDPDRYFHLALARETVASGRLFLQQIPQITGLGWERVFPDKEFLFHFINRWLYAWGGDAGVLRIIPVAAAAILVVLSLLVQRYVRPAVGAFIISLFVLTDPWLLIRLSMLRPHLLAILFFCGVLHSLLRRSAIGLFVFGVMYSWSYHSFYVPLMLMGIFYAVDLQWKSPKLRLVIWGALGLLTGLIVHPHFPWNLWMSFRHAVIALFEASKSKLDFGVELFPWSTEKFLRLHLPYFYILVSSPFLVLLGVEKPREFLRKSDFLWLWASALVFLTLAAQNPRALEYAIPIGVVLMAFVAQSFGSSRRRTTVFLVGLALVAIPRMMQLSTTLSESVDPAQRGERLEKLVSSLRALPASPDGQSARTHLFNIEWDQAPYVYYARPDFQFLDILDPSFLESRDNRLHSVRWMLRSGTVPDPWGVMQSLTRSRYVLSRYPDVNAQLAADLNFKRIFPKVGEPTEGVENLFELLPERDPHFVLEWNGQALLQSGSGREADVLSPESAKAGREKMLVTWHEHLEREAAGIEVPRVKSAYLDLRYGTIVRSLGLKSGKESLGDGVTCALVEPSREERKRQVGRNVIVLGGGRSLRVWLNGQKFYRSVAARDGVQLADRLVPVGRSLTAEDRIQVIVCSKDAAPSLGVALSFWTPKEISDRCAERGWKPAEALQDSKSWPRVGDYRETCLGSYVRSR
jgi:hypothetical protein